MGKEYKDERIDKIENNDKTDKSLVRLLYLIEHCQASQVRDKRFETFLQVGRFRTESLTYLEKRNTFFVNSHPQPTANRC